MWLGQTTLSAEKLRPGVEGIRRLRQNQVSWSPCPTTVGRESQLLIRDLRNLSAKGLWPLGPSLFSAPGHPGGGKPG